VDFLSCEGVCGPWEETIPCAMRREKDFLDVTKVGGGRVLICRVQYRLWRAATNSQPVFFAVAGLLG
jgi:hypothetical protein